jgi:hypothetical protein
MVSSPMPRPHIVISFLPPSQQPPQPPPTQQQESLQQQQLAQQNVSPQRIKSGADVMNKLSQVDAQDVTPIHTPQASSLRRLAAYILSRPGELVEVFKDVIKARFPNMRVPSTKEIWALIAFAISKSPNLKELMEKLLGNTYESTLGRVTSQVQSPIVTKEGMAKWTKRAAIVALVVGILYAVYYFRQDIEKTYESNKPHVQDYAQRMYDYVSSSSSSEFPMHGMDGIRHPTPLTDFNQSKAVVPYTNQIMDYDDNTWYNKAKEYVQQTFHSDNVKDAMHSLELLKNRLYMVVDGYQKSYHTWRNQKLWEAMHDTGTLNKTK